MTHEVSSLEVSAQSRNLAKSLPTVTLGHGQGVFYRGCEVSSSCEGSTPLQFYYFGHDYETASLYTGSPSKHVKMYTLEGGGRFLAVSPDSARRFDQFFESFGSTSALFMAWRAWSRYDPTENTCAIDSWDNSIALHELAGPVLLQLGFDGFQVEKGFYRKKGGEFHAETVIYKAGVSKIRQVGSEMCEIVLTKKGGTTTAAGAAVGWVAGGILSAVVVGAIVLLILSLLKTSNSGKKGSSVTRLSN